MYKLDKTFSKAQTIVEAEQDKKFPKEMRAGERLREAWWLICAAYGIDYANPPKLDREFFIVRKHEQ